MHGTSRFFSVLTVIIGILLLMGTCRVSAEETISFTPEEESYIASHPSVKVGFVPDRIPISFADKNGEPAGISRYIFDRVSQLTGMDFEYAALPTSDVTYDYLLGENFDLVTSVEYNEENKKARGIMISEPYLSSRKVIVAKEGLEFRYGANLTAAVSTGSQTLKKVLNGMFPSFDLKDYDSISDCLDAVNNGDADILIQNQYVVEYWLAKPEYEKLTVIPMIGLDDKLCFSAVVGFDGTGAGPSQEDGQTLIDILDKAIAQISDDEAGSYIIQGVMANQYEYTFTDFISRYRYAVGIFIVLFIIIIALTILLARQRIRFAESRADAKAKGRFLSTMSHEIRTPLNGLIGLNYLMAQNYDNEEKVKDYLRQSSATAKYLLSLVNDILDSSKLEAEKMELLIQPMDLSLLLETIDSIERNAMNEKKLNFSITPEIKYPYIMGDSIRIQQVILNLLDNARKFTPKGGIVDLALKQELSKGKILTTVTVSDTGKGMSEEFQKKVFDLFAQELETVSKGNQGTGLGLPISRRLAGLMGGDITCVSKKDEGSTFTFTFISDISDPPPKNDPADNDGAGPLPRVLVAEDNELNGEIITELLRSGGFETEIAVNGKKVLEIFEKSEPGTYGVILMDLLMPEMNGFETARAIRALDRSDAKTVKIFACTANSFSEERERAIASGMDDFISKPVDIDELLKKLRSVR